MTQAEKNILIKVRDTSGTYIATGGGMRASCAAGALMAAERLAGKLAAGRPWEIWEISDPQKDGIRRWVYKEER